MALNWYWSEHLGTVTRTDSRTGSTFYTDLYRGNAFIIEIYTNPETDCYNLYSFWGDAKHAENCIKDNLKIYDNARIILLEKALKEEYKPTDRKKLIEYMLKSGGCVQIITES